MQAPRRVLVLVTLLTLWPAALVAAQGEDLVREGVRLHDAGDYDGAIAVFREALEADPDNALARYEMANTHFAAASIHLDDSEKKPAASPHPAAPPPNHPSGSSRNRGASGTS